jgi:hypothetical protein
MSTHSADTLAEALRECWTDVSNETGYADEMVAAALRQYDGRADA